MLDITCRHTVLEELSLAAPGGVVIKRSIIELIIPTTVFVVVLLFVVVLFAVLTVAHFFIRRHVVDWTIPAKFRRIRVGRVTNCTWWLASTVERVRTVLILRKVVLGGNIFEGEKNKRKNKRKNEERERGGNKSEK